MDSFEQFCTVKRGDQIGDHRGDQNCEETAKFADVSSREMNFDDGLSRRKLRVRVSSIPQNRGHNELLIVTLNNQLLGK